MASTKRRQRRAAAPVASADGFEELRGEFYKRLRSERAHFVTLSTALARAEESPSWIFEDLQFRAHRLRGGATIFEVNDVASAANELEQAAVSAANSRASNKDAGVWSALLALLKLMGTPSDGALITG